MALGVFLSFSGADFAARADDVATTLAPVTRALDNFGKDACRSFKLKCNKAAVKSNTRKPRRAKAVKAARPAAVKPPVPAPKQNPAAAGPKVINTPVVPRSKPLRVTPTPSDISAPKIAAEPPTPVPEKLAPLPPRIEDSAPCLAVLKANKVEFESVIQPANEGGCHVDTPVRVTAVATPSGTVRLAEAPVFNCHFALQFSRWLSEAGSAVIITQLHTRLVKVATGPGYVCRGRNGDASAKLSEHALGNAVDITTLTTADGATIQVSDAIIPASRAFGALKAMRSTACGYFTTVLGPGANAAHATHFHFDLGVHGKSGNYKICE